MGNSKDHYEKLFNNLPIGIYRSHWEGAVLDANPAFIQLLGYPDKQSLLEVEVAGLIVGREARESWEKQLLETGAVRHFEYQISCYDGNSIWVEDNSQAVYDNDGRILFIEGALIDITERKRAEAAEKEQGMLAEQKRRRIEEVLRQAASVLNSTLALDLVLNHILEQLAEAIPHDSASVQQLEEDHLTIKAVQGFQGPEKLIGLDIPIADKYPNHRVIQDKRPISFPDVSEAYPHFHDEADIFEAGHIRSWLGVPLIANDLAIGMITVDRKKVHPFSAEEIELAVAFANHAAIALQNAQWYEKLESYSESLERLVEERTAVLQRTTDQVEAILLNSPDAILLLDANGLIELGNPAIYDLFGYNPADLVGFPLNCLISAGAKRPLAYTLQMVLKKREKMRLELTALHQDGSDFDADVALAPIMKEGDVITGMVCTFRDISPLKEVERMKDAFVSNVSHELRTPIAALRLNHYLLQRNPVKQSRYMERLKRDIDRLNALIEDLLSLSRLDQLKGELELIPVDLNVMAEQYAADRVALAESKGLKLLLEQYNPLPTVLVNEGLISQTLSILLTNAFNYTPEGGKVTISTTLRQEDGQYWAGLRVRDTGPGIQPEDHPRLFERFYRGNAARESGAPGTGLGLSIAQEIVKRHQGELEVSSEGDNEKGSIFTVWLKI